MTQNSTFRARPGFTTPDGHRYVSVPTDIPTTWGRSRNGAGRLVRESGDYKIVREPYVGTQYTFSLYRLVNGKWIDLGIGSYSLLKDAKADAMKNARGEHVINWA
jgi:hypothetical protein